MGMTVPAYAAIYCRRSVEQGDRADEAKSVTRQRDEALAFAARHGKKVREEHIYIDDGISGAEFGKRAGLQRLLDRIDAPQVPFEWLIVSEFKSIGRESVETQFIIKQLAKAGVEVFSYMENRSLTPRGWVDKAMNAIKAATAEAHREEDSRRMFEENMRIVRAGRFAGGRTFGYQNVKAVDDYGRSLGGFNRVINEAEAEVVRRMFREYADGKGYTRIATMLTSEGALSPHTRVPKGQTPVGGWIPATVRNVMRNELYRGVHVWAKSKKRDDWGEVQVSKRDAADIVRVEVPQLRIIDDDLWNEVQRRRADLEQRAVRLGKGRLGGRPPRMMTKNLLAGISECALCGGGLIIESYRTRSDGTTRGTCYVCHRYRSNKKCANYLRMPADVLEEAVLQAVEEHALTPEAIEQVLLVSERAGQDDERASLEKQLKVLLKRESRLVAAVEQGGDVPVLVAQLKQVATEKADLQSALAGMQPIPRPAPQVIASRLDEWRKLLRSSTTQARGVLDRVLAGRIVFMPHIENGNLLGYTFEAPTRFDRLFYGIAVPRPAYIPNDTRGTEHIGVEDTFEGDFGRLLARAQDAALRWWRPRADLNRRPTA